MTSSYAGDDVSLSFDAQPGMTAPQHRRPLSQQPAVPGYGYGQPGQPAYQYGQQPMQQQQQPQIPSQQQQFGVPSSFHPSAQQPPAAAPAGPPNMAFMSFDLSNTAGGFPPPPNVGPAPGGSTSFGGSGNGFGASAYFEDEPPLLEELGIDLPQIMRKTVSALNPLRVNPDLFEDGDLSGPLLFIMLFGLGQLLGGKVHFGVILGWSAASSTVLWAMANLLSGSDAQQMGIELYRCCSLFGYSMLPLVAFSPLSIFIPRKGFFLIIAAAAVVSWCTRTCLNLIISFLPQPDDYRLLVGYLCALLYTCFAMLIVF